MGLLVTITVFWILGGLVYFMSIGSWDWTTAFTQSRMARDSKRFKVWVGGSIVLVVLIILMR